MGYGEWKPYVSAAERRKKAERAAAKATKRGADLSPVASCRGAVAKTFWGKAWCQNLEHYSDFANRLPRGRTYVRNGAVIDLKVTPGEVRAQVMGSRLYKVAVSVTAVPPKHWQAIGSDCSGSIDTLVELLQGKLSKAVMERICKPGTGLFPAPKEIEFVCSCPDWASMCKHVAAVLYGVGARLDEQPELIFSLRRVDAKDLVSHAGASLPKAAKRPAAGRVLDDALLADVFGIEMADASPTKAAARRGKPAAVKVTTSKVAARKASKAIASTTRPSPAPAKTVAGAKAGTRSLAAKATAELRRTTIGKVIAAKTIAAGASSVADPKMVRTKRRGVQRKKKSPAKRDPVS